MKPRWAIERTRRLFFPLWAESQKSQAMSSEFTGSVVMEPNGKTDRLYLTSPDCVMPVPAHYNKDVRS